jgi:hypothetical protein
VHSSLYLLLPHTLRFPKLPFLSRLAMTFPLPPEVSIDEKMAAFDDTPLFMKSLPEDALDNPVVNALQSLAFEGTPDGTDSCS